MNKLIVAMALVAFSAVAFADHHETAPGAPAKMEKAGKKMKKAKTEKHTEEHKTTEAPK